MVEHQKIITFALTINGIEDHIHILSDLHSSISLADFVKSIKVATSLWLKQSPDFQSFKGWGEGYAAFTYSYQDKEKLINYIKNQQEHHKKENTQSELMRIWKLTPNRFASLGGIHIQSCGL